MDLDNRKIKEGHGCILERIYSVLHELAGQTDVFVRERGFTRFNAGSQALFKVVGIADLAVWQAKRGIFDEIPPTTVKKLLTSNGMASKEEVADALAMYVGSFQYTSDDQSDAVAVGVAWVLRMWPREKWGMS